MERAVDELGRIVLPIDLRQRYKIKEKDRLIIHERPEGIFLIKSKDSCFFCEGKRKLIKIKGFSICQDCISKMALAKVGETVNLNEVETE